MNSILENRSVVLKKNVNIVEDIQSQFPKHIILDLPHMKKRDMDKSFKDLDEDTIIIVDGYNDLTSELLIKDLIVYSEKYYIILIKSNITI